MFCANCGKSVPNDAKFCGSCGNKLSSAAQAPVGEATPEVPQEPIATHIPEGVSTEIPQEPMDTQVSEEFPEEDVPEIPQEPAAEQTDILPPSAPRKRNKKLLICAAAAALVLMIVGAFFLFDGSAGKKDDAYIYLSDGSYRRITSIQQGTSVEIANSKTESSNLSHLFFSPDGRYVYYLTKYNKDSETGTLCRAQYGKFRENASNDKYIDIIASNVLGGFSFVNDSTVLYLNGDNTLYWFNGKDTVQLAKSVVDYATDGKTRLVYYIESEVNTETYDLYAVDLSKTEEEALLDSGISFFYNALDLDNILYEKSDQELYVTGFSKEPRKLAEEVDDVYFYNGITYFTANSDASVNLSDYVEDTYADADAGLTKPEYSDFSTPYYVYNRLYGNGLAESNYPELYTSCTKSLYLFGYYSMEQALTKDWGENTAALHAAIQSFIDQFGTTATDDGYILVTDEVKVALQQIQQCGGTPEESWQWLWMCFTRYQSGTTTDYDAYNSAYGKWSEASTRMYIREELADPEKNVYPVKTLYCYSNGECTTIADNILNADTVDMGGIIYNTVEMVTTKLDINEIQSIYDIQALLDIQPGAENYLLVYGQTDVGLFSSSAAGTIGAAVEDNDIALFFSSSKVYLNEENGILAEASIIDGLVNKFNIISDDAIFISATDDTLYYATNQYNTDDMQYCDLCSYSNGSSKTLAKDILPLFKIFEDGSILACTGYVEDYGLELTMFNAKGEATIIANNITQYIRVNSSTLLYISDGDLYNYNGNDRSRIATDVDFIWSLNCMDSQYSYPMDYYTYNYSSEASIYPEYYYDYYLS